MSELKIYVAGGGTPKMKTATNIIIVIFMATYLLAAGCMQRPYRPDAELISAVANGEVGNVRKALAQGANVNVRSGADSENDTPLMIAASNRKLEIAKLLIEQGAKLDLQNDDGETALGKAVSFEHNDIVRLLLIRGSEPFPLHRAAITGDLKKVSTLVTRKVDINRTNANGCTPLLLAAITGKKDVVRILLANHADPNKKDKLGFTPLYQASRYGYLDIVVALVNHGGDIQVKPENKHFTAIEIADIYSHDAIAAFLRKHAK